MPDLDFPTLLRATKEANASDLHLTTGSPPMMRLDGELRKTDAPVLTRESAQALIEQAMTESQRATWREKLDLDFAYEIADVARFRINAFYQRQGPGAVCRLIPYKIRTIEELGMPKQVLKFADFKKGLCLVTGATGSGKSSTLAALVDHINRNRHEHIITVEDPIEFVHQNQGCLVNQREVGLNTRSFSAALRAALREDPDITLVGEMRDLETIELAITAAETGHLVFGTLHTNSAPDAVDRVINVFPVNQQQQIRQVMSNVLIGVIAQNLLKRTGGGRVAAIEVMFCNQAIANLIREAKTFQIPSMMQMAKKEGMQTMDQALQALFQEKKISALEAYQYAVQKDLFAQAAGVSTGGAAPAAPPG